MIKNLTFLTITILISISCGNRKSNDVSQNQSSNETISQKPTKDYSDLGYKLMKDERIGSIRLGMKNEDVIRQFGTPDETTVPEFSDVDGQYYQSIDYKNKGLALGILINADSTKEVSWIEIQKPCDLKTSKNIGIGSNYSDVENAYKQFIDPSYKNSDNITCGSPYGGMFIDFSEGKVSKIYIGAGAD